AGPGRRRLPHPGAAELEGRVRPRGDRAQRRRGRRDAARAGTMSPPDPVAAALRRVRSRSAPGRELPAGARVTLHFHPEADASGTGVLESILDRGQYVSLFVTGTSNGGLTAFPGGDRWNWEQRMFGGAYDHVQGQHRPVYGALDLVGDPYGPAPRFGSVNLRLRRETLSRSPIAYPDGAFGP